MFRAAIHACDTADSLGKMVAFERLYIADFEAFNVFRSGLSVRCVPASCTRSAMYVLLEAT